ncbi:trans-2-enoyl-CoA reductase catalytic region [Treponema socranskii subsp. socranskii VPI DR56BR1116 = ATCC 35536]|uniref:Trans-2-enoyl-CoA reductase [NADH] n=1 Tax=Treponema socranskii subsp. socranskii VPI DR56BR1116 = ATCC 35536 TaxID=1125725 RepID=U1FL06_TRESO|nr:enoyl-ACP reductase FabV [Treponema socranskii]ERF60503.1 trans-2-enoyl-CoA reductase catalytic region [Treponema socranskii subsp. socranskii VPI DR56BR1116 = ATCC 35536]ERJ97659.1 trans-2-enoyl-CoA reductase catalytic region [Treponema socranskii subsp. socranskii VPI DR56BR1116 = ATCC 35536]
MIIKPMVRSSICINAHPVGCAKETENEIAYIKAQKEKRGIKGAKEGGAGPKTVLVLGCSTGYGLASRIVAAFEYGADTIGVSFEKAGTETKGGTPGWYNNAAFDRAAKKEGLASVTLNADAFADETRALVIDEVKKLGAKFDLIIYSLASPVRTDPDTKVLYKSVIKPRGKPYSGKCIDIMTETLKDSSAEPATEEEIASTIKVMGGDDWRRWIKQLSDAGVLAQGCRTIAYSYIGPELSHAIYRDGTIGTAKLDLEKAALDLDKELKSSVGGGAYISVNKGLVTRSSAVIPIISLYLSILFKVMKEKGTHEGCIEQMERLFTERLYTADGTVPTDSEHRIRIDDLELADDVQKKCLERMKSVTQENLRDLCDLEGYKHDFLAANGFDIAGVDYDKDVARMDTID